MAASDVRHLPAQVTQVRDGTSLVSNIWLPAGSDRVPAILLRTPYSNAQSEYDRYGLDVYVQAGFAVVFQTVRGRPPSAGDFGFFFVEGNDGYDTIEWVASQPWCDGRVGMDGGSYLGTVQWLAAREQSPHLKCIAPSVPAGDYFNEIPYLGGALHLGGSLVWFADLAGTSIDFAERNEENLENYRPLGRADELQGIDLPIFRDVLDHPTLDEYWQQIQFSERDFDRINIPTLTVTGWFDGDQPGSLFYWRGLQNSDSARRQDSRLIIGPWNHQQCYLGAERSLHELDFADNVFYPLQQTRLAFFNAYLKDSTADIARIPRVQIYITGKNEWQEFGSYPPPGCDNRPLYLASRGCANGRGGDGRLVWAPADTQCSDQYTYDPLRPMRYCHGGEDLSGLETRADMLVYTSEPVDEPLQITGPVVLELFAASDAPDTDFVARLADVYPDGRSINLTHTQGVVRARYRNGYDKAEFLSPGKVEFYRIKLMNLGHAFMPGHRIRLEVMSSCFPLIDPNTNTGGDPATDTEYRLALQTIHHGTAQPSCLRLPIYN